ncbi:MAG: reverse transcriptase/maturase family protein [Candidatus Saganbacteria bacterium]|nr:reverse transcriptase/maturase family protein [Candidatus Saganbacteria bacterium]
MKRYGYLFEEICSFENLVKAAKKAQKGKRFKDSTCEFNLKLEDELLTIQEELCQKTYQVGQYKHFYVFDPKKRLISALPYRDRVVQHALCNVIEPIFDRTFVPVSYACRKNKGSHKAVSLFSRFCRSNSYVLKCDIKSYFAAIDHDLLYELIARKIKDPQALWLVRLIIDSTPNPGIPIGNLTSQVFANLYLNGLDHLIKENAKFRYYIRYMDDLVIFDNDSDKLDRISDFITACFIGLKLKMHPYKCKVYETKKGVKFLGYIIYPTHQLVILSNVARFKRRMKRLVLLFQQGLITLRRITCSIHSWLGYAKHANSYNIRRRVFSEIKITG